MPQARNPKLGGAKTKEIIQKTLPTDSRGQETAGGKIMFSESQIESHPSKKIGIEEPENRLRCPLLYETVSRPYNKIGNL